MKIISSGLSTHLKSEVTTLCTCWRVVRKDGQVFGFTDHDQDLLIEGVLYESETGYNRTAIQSDRSFGVDNLDVKGYINSDRITEHDLRNGLFNRAEVYIFAVNWADITQGVLKLRRGWFGEVVVSDNGEFETEIRGLNQALAHSFMESFSPECRADFCDTRCKLNIADYEHEGTVFAAISRLQFRASTLPDVPSSGSSSLGAHRFWRIRSIVAPHPEDICGFAEIEFYDQNDAEINGGSTEASTQNQNNIIDSIFGDTFKAKFARDGNHRSSWRCDPGDGQFAWWQIDFGSAKDVKSFRIMAPLDHREAPTAFELQWSDDTGEVKTWHTAKSCTMAWASANQQALWVIGTDISDPVNIADAQGALPATFTGASTFVGGTIRFTSGLNKGKILEIIAYEKATEKITMFEGFPHEIKVGDTFVIAQGCDKRFGTCKVYENQKNFRGEPHVPGEDELLKYPDAKS